MLKKQAAALTVAGLIAATASFDSRAQSGTVNLTAFDLAYQENFDTLASSGTSSLLPAGWEILEAGTNANLTYTAGTGSGNAGDTYSFGSTAATDRALGGLFSGSLTPLFGVAFSNSTGQLITSLDVSFTGEQWRLGTAGRADRLDFQYSVDATALDNGTWTSLDALDFVSPATSVIGALDGNSAANGATLSAVITGIWVPPGSTIRFRWQDFNASGADDGLAVDDVSVTPHGGGGGPILSIADASVTEGNGGAVTATFTVTVSTAAHPGITFDIATVDGTGAAAATVADGDYVPQALTSVTLPTGETTFAFDVTINGDTAVEPTETFTVVLSAVTGATLADGTALGTIVNDDDPQPVVSDVVISQVYGGGGNSGAPLKNDYIELFNRGTSAMPGWLVGAVQRREPDDCLASHAAHRHDSANTYYLIQEAAGTGVAPPLPTPDASGTIPLGSTAGKVALVATTTPITGACPANAIDIVGYGATNCFEGTGSAPTLSNTTAALRVHGGCADANDNGADFVSGNPSPRNSLLGARSCIPVDAAIHDIQGDGAISTLVGQEVQTSGIVTAAKSNGFFLQAPDALADNNPATSEGIFVFTRRPPAVAVGNVATVRSTVSEFFGLTQLESPLIADVTVTAASAELPSPIELTTAILDPAGTPEQLERFEGMRLHAASLTSVAPTNEFGEIATVLTGVPRPLREPGISVLDPVPPIRRLAPSTVASRA